MSVFFRLILVYYSLKYKLRFSTLYNLNYIIYNLNYIKYFILNYICIIINYFIDIFYFYLFKALFYCSYFVEIDNYNRLSQIVTNIIINNNILELV